jgi:DNA-binding MarR family transcriptional regulator
VCSTRPNTQPNPAWHLISMSLSRTQDARFLIEMSMTALRVAFSQIGEAKIGLPARLVLLCLANRHNQETGRCDPSIATICKDTGLSERSVRQGLRQLEAEGLISTVHRVQRTGRGKRNISNRYRLKGGAQYAGGMGHNMPPKQEIYQPSAFDDLSMLLEDGSKSPVQDRDTGGQSDV